ncbi:MAG: hypothetical protein ABI840_13150, partial [bacterium]
MKPQSEIMSSEQPEEQTQIAEKQISSGIENSSDTKAEIPVIPGNFNSYSYSKKSHFKVYSENGYDKLFYGEEIGPEGFLIKTYQNLLVFSFIKQNISEGARILEIGNGDDYIQNHFQYLYDCWRIEDASNLAYDRETL